MMGRITRGAVPLTAVMHVAGVIDDGVLDRLDTGRLGGVLAAKATGAALLDELTGDLGLEQFVLFSSAAATFGGPGQGNYAAANAYLDALAQRRASAGLAGLSVAWGPWAGGGVAQSGAAVRQRLRRGPMREMDPDLAVKALEQALGGPDSLLALMDVDWAKYAATATPFVRDIPEVIDLARERVRDSGAGDRVLADGELTRQLAGMPRARQIHILMDLIQAVAAAVLGHAGAAIGADQVFSDLGFDSLTSLELRQQVGAATGLRLPATLLFDHPTPAVLAEYLWTEAFGQDADYVPILEELDRLEARLSSMARDEAGRAEITARLERIALTLRGGPADAGPAEHDLETA
jgi:acyl carrier protein